MEKGYKDIFWGLFIATFNINLGFVKILPAFIGWILLRSGVHMLMEEFKTQAYVRAIKFSDYLIVMSIIGGLTSLVGGTHINRFVLFNYFPILVIVLELLTIFYIIEGSIEYLVSKEQKIYQTQYEVSLKTYTIFFCIATLLICIGITLNNSLLFIGSILTIILRISVMVMINNFKKLYLNHIKPTP